MTRDKQEPTSNIACILCTGIAERSNRLGLCPECDRHDAWTDLCDAVYNGKAATESPATEVSDLHQRAVDLLDMLQQNIDGGDTIEAQAINCADLIAEISAYVRTEILPKCDPENLRAHAAEYRP